MVKVGRIRTGIAAACVGLLCSAALVVPSAQALMYVHSEQAADAGLGVVHIAVTLDCTAVDGPKKAVWLPVNHDGATVEAVLNEFLNASEDKTDRFAHADYDMQSLADFLSDKEYTIAVYKAGAQKPGAGAAYTSDSIGDVAYVGLETGDGVYVTVSK